MNTISNIDLLSVGIAISANIILGCIVFYKDPKNTTGRLFLLQTIILSCWSVLNYLSYRISDLGVILWMQRLVLFFAVPNSIIFMLLMHTFPRQTFAMSRRLVTEIILLCLVTMGLTLTPFVFSGVMVVPGVLAPQPIVQPGMIAFILVAVLTIPLGMYFLIKKYIRSVGIERGQFRFLLFGVLSMFFFIITFNFIFPTFFQNTRFIPLSAVFTFPFVVFTFYSIYKHGLLKVKVVSTEILTFILTVVTFIEIIFSISLAEILLRSSIFILILIFGISLIRSILRDIEQRERIEALARDLEKANENQVSLIHFITHQVKGFFTKSRDIFSLLLEGDEGVIPEEAKEMIRKGFDSDTKGVAMVQDVLNAANIKSGIVKYAMKSFDLRATIEALMPDFHSAAQEKGLAFDFNFDNKISAAAPALSDFNVTGDEEQLKQVFKNLIDNSIKYTKKGTVTVTLGRTMGASKILFSVKDTGVGITPEDKALLFTQGGRGKDSVSVNVESTGYGLFIAKSIVEAHHGRIWAESEGAGRGSQFYVELPGKSVTLER